ncbi:MAG: preprotein translocase subunit SecD [Nanoarchaeota archaeon]|nr:preprotein translocase subunit SecD [Nanoarchaeota archaeon]
MSGAKKLKRIFKNTRVLILLFFLLCAIFAIWPMLGREGVAIQSVVKDSSAYEAGIQVDPTTRPTAREIITYLDNTQIKNLDDYYAYIDTIGANRTVRVETNQNVYHLTTLESGDLGIAVINAPKSNLRKGLDLTGGTRVFLQPEEEVEDYVLENVVDSLKLRLNTFGLSDIVVKKVTMPDQYIIVEIAGATQEEVKDLISQQGKFEAKIANETVFVGGEDIVFVGVGAQDAYVKECGPTGGGSFSCGFEFRITVTQEAAERFADATAKLDIDGDHLSEPIRLFLDDEEISNLSIASSLKGRAITTPSINGGSSGRDQREAYENAQAEMNHLQTILETGTLPIKLEIVESLTLSPFLGSEFTKNAIFVGFLAILTVAIVVFIRFRRFAISIPMFITMISEVVLLLGLASLTSWQLDLAAIAGIIVAAGTGVDDQIVITDEVLRGESKASYGWKQKLKRAFFIIMAAYFTTIVATIPLFWAGAGILKGFAFITIAGVTFGVFITRPAFANIIEILLGD